MTAWKRWSWRYRVGALFVVMVMLPGLAGCVLPTYPTTYTVPGVNGTVYDRQTGADGRPYYGVETEVNGRLQQRVVYPGSREYELIDAFFRELRKPGHGADRSAIPGGTGALPVPPVQ